jgi:L-asparaginase
MNKKVLILFCGGTIIMKENENGVLEAPPKKEAVKTLLSLEPKLETIADLQLEFIANIDSTNITPEIWDRLCSEIYKNYDKYDGFVITHGTDTMAYTASALSLGLENLGKPVILTGSQIPGYELNSDARRNIVNAVKLAVMDLSGVFIVFDERIISGMRATKASESRLDAFSSVNTPDAGEIKICIKLSNRVKKRHSRKPSLKTGYDPDIFVYRLTPDADPSDLVFLLKNNRIKGIIIEAFGTGNLPDNFNTFFKKANGNKVPVIVTSQCLNGMTMMKSYAVGQKALDLGVIEGYDQSLETLAVKLMWALKHYKYEEIRGIINKNITGELDMTYLT